MTEAAAGDISGADDTIAALRLALARLDADTTAGDIRINDGVIWALCDVALGGFARAYLAESFRIAGQREAHDRTLVELGDWRDHIRAEFEELAGTLTLAALEAGFRGPSAPRS